MSLSARFLKLCGYFITVFDESEGRSNVMFEFAESELIVQKQKLLVERDDITILNESGRAPALLTITSGDSNTLEDIAFINRRLFEYVFFADCLLAAEKAEIITVGDLALCEIGITEVNRHHSEIKYMVDYVLRSCDINTHLSQRDRDRVKTFCIECQKYLAATLAASREILEKYGNILNVPRYEEYEEY